MNRLSTDRRAAVLACLVDGASIRATVRMTGAAKNTVTKLLCEVGAACLRYQDETLVDLPCRRVQVDEIWAFVGCKAKNVDSTKASTREKYPWLGDVWTWTALCQDTKLVPSWLVGGRDARWARFFIEDLALRLRGRVQLTSDGHKPYLEVVRNVFGADGIDYAMLVKLYGAAYLNENGDHRYSPSACIGFEKTPVFGDPTWEDICTSHVERQNLTMRMNMRRFTRLTNAFSKKVENLRHAVALHFMHYNFARRHMTLGTSPAYAAGKADHVWSLREIAELPERYEDETLLAAA